MAEEKCAPMLLTKQEAAAIEFHRTQLREFLYGGGTDKPNGVFKGQGGTVKMSDGSTAKIDTWTADDNLSQK